MLRFSGRDAPREFWPFTGLVFIATQLLAVVPFVAEIARTFGKMRKFAADNPDQATVTRGPGSYSIQIEGNHPELAPDFGYLVIIIGICAAIFIVLTAAAIVRRLHDSNVTGFFALIPAGLLAFGFWNMSKLFGQSGSLSEPDMGLFITGFLGNLVYLISVGVLIYFLVRKGTAGENKFGPSSQTNLSP